MIKSKAAKKAHKSIINYFRKILKSRKAPAEKKAQARKVIINSKVRK